MRQAVFTIECTCRIIAQGLFFGRGLKIPMHPRSPKAFAERNTSRRRCAEPVLLERALQLDRHDGGAEPELWILGSSLFASTNKVIFTFVEPFAAEAPAPSARHDVSDVERSARFKLSWRELGRRA